MYASFHILICAIMLLPAITKAQTPQTIESSTKMREPSITALRLTSDLVASWVSYNDGDHTVYTAGSTNGGANWGSSAAVENPNTSLYQAIADSKVACRYYGQTSTSAGTPECVIVFRTVDNSDDTHNDGVWVEFSPMTDNGQTWGTRPI